MDPDSALEAVREMRHTLAKQEKRSRERQVIWPVLELLCEDLASRSGSTPDLLAQLREALDRAAPSQLADDVRELTEDDITADLDSSDDDSVLDTDGFNVPISPETAAALKKAKKFEVNVVKVPRE